ncbi:MAG: YebC/PmpR family DNA-binding transcriptional regulator [SAR202 cluster bacterium]|jgi:YebC/PmpR family DNA-binding regulatory protein|nr:YebC/PmpR family DNA-binding transcriptional regulator [SAR202 cluster bacterium]
MAGHSHWAGIKHKKGRADKQRSKIFSKLSKEITVAAKLGSKDPDMNPRLRSSIQSARTLNMPKDNIERAIKKSETNKNLNYNSLTYEGFGPEKIAIIVEALTDNKNRTASNIRTIFQKFGGNLGEPGVASHQFKQVGVIRIDKKKISDNDILELSINEGAEDSLSNSQYHEVIIAKDNYYKVKFGIEKKIQEFISARIEWLPINKISLNQEKTKSVLNFLKTLEDDDDIQHVYANLEINNDFEEKILI